MTYCIACESNEKSLTYEKHLHAFIEFKNPIFVEEICEYIRIIYD